MWVRFRGMSVRQKTPEFLTFLWLYKVPRLSKNCGVIGESLAEEFGGSVAEATVLNEGSKSLKRLHWLHRRSICSQMLLPRCNSRRLYFVRSECDAILYPSTAKQVCQRTAGTAHQAFCKSAHLSHCCSGAGRSMFCSSGSNI